MWRPFVLFVKSLSCVPSLSWHLFWARNIGTENEVGDKPVCSSSAKEREESEVCEPERVWLVPVSASIHVGSRGVGLITELDL